MSALKEFDALQKELKIYGWSGLFHYTDFTNFVNIMKRGALLSKHRAQKENLLRWEMNRREATVAMGVDLSEYTRFYYAPKTTMLYESEGVKAEEKGTAHMPVPVLLVFRKELVMNEDALFFDGDAENRNSFCYDNLAEARYKMDWQGVFSRFEQDPDDFYSARVRCAELLLPDEVALQGNLVAVVFRTMADLKNAQNIVGFNPLFMIDKTMFNNFKGWNNAGIGGNRRKNVYNYIMDYDIGIEGNTLEMHYSFASDELSRYAHEFKITYASGTTQVDDSDYDGNAVEWDLEEDIIRDEPFEVSYSINGHRLIYWYSDDWTGPRGV